MRQRVLRIGVLVAALFLINVIARLVARLAFGDATAEHLAAQERLAWLGWASVALVMAVAAWWWGRQRTPGEVATDLTIGAAAAGLLYVTAGPFISGPPWFEEGLGGSIISLTIYLSVAGVGALLGMLLLIALGRDYTSRALRDYAQARSTRPRRAVRR
jgi:hypothetical protein